VVPAGESRRPTDFAIKPGTGRVLLVYEREKPDPAAKEVVATFYRNLAAGKAKDNESLFRGPDVAVSGVFRGGGGPKAWRKTPAEYLAGHGNEQKYSVADCFAVRGDPLRLVSRTATAGDHRLRSPTNDKNAPGAEAPGANSLFGCLV
jgi:hypothetical protein